MNDQHFRNGRGERLERRDRSTRSQVLQDKKDIDGLKGVVDGLRDRARRSKEVEADHEERNTRTEVALALRNYRCPHCGAVGAHYAFSCGRR